jgi:alpha-L-fucosidase
MGNSDLITKTVSRRESLKYLLSAAAVTGLTPSAFSGGLDVASDLLPARHEERIAWWRNARFGMFVHWGLYSILARDAWAMGDEDIPLLEYVRLANQFQPQKGAPRVWARLARETGMKYMVMTAKHHEGFCLFDSQLTDYCAPKQAAGRDLVREYVEAARSEGLRVGLYYSLMDWHHPDWRKCKQSEEARARFVQYTHSQISELLTKYGKIDILWYDMAVPLDAAGWQSERLNKMVFDLQPEIIVNNRNGIPGDFSTPEQNVKPSTGDWETCMTLNDCWGYVAGDHNWKSPHHLVQNLVDCSANGGNFLLNIGPRADGSVPEPCVTVLGEVGRWVRENAGSIYQTQRCHFPHGDICAFTRRGSTLYIHVYYWPGEVITIGGVTTRIRSAKLLSTGEKVSFTQKDRQLILSGLPHQGPDDLIPVIEVECDSEPVQHALSSVVDQT